MDTARVREGGRGKITEIIREKKPVNCNRREVQRGGGKKGQDAHVGFEIYSGYLEIGSEGAWRPAWALICQRKVMCSFLVGRIPFHVFLANVDWL